MAVTRADINPAILRWGRARSRLQPDELARKVQVAESQVALWEQGDRKPTLRQLYKLAEALHIPAHLFYASQPPDTPEPLAELRRVSGADIGDATPELAEEVAILLEHRDIALALLRDLGRQPVEFKLSLDATDSPARSGGLVRDALGVALQEQFEWTNAHQAFNNWRTAVERIGVLVFNVPNVAVSEMRGVAMQHQPLPIVGVNAKDAINARVFTVMHELVHLALGQSSIYTGAEPLDRIRSDYPTERFCNAVAAAVLVPEPGLREQVESARGAVSRAAPLDGLVTRLARQYTVSKSMMTRRLGDLRLLGSEEVLQLTRVYDRYRARRGGGGDFYATQLSRLGGVIPQLAFESYYAQRATAQDLSSIFGTKVKNLEKFEAKLNAAAGSGRG